MTDHDDPQQPDLKRRQFLKHGASYSAAAVVLPGVPVGNIKDSDNEFVEHALTFFDTLALTQERRGHTRHTWVRKWGWPATVRVHGAATDDLRQELEAAVNELRDLTGHELGFEGDGERRMGTIDVYISPHDQISGRFRAPDAVCNTRSRGARGALYFARVDISEDYTDCLRHELMHALGFANHWKGPLAMTSMPSILAMRKNPGRVWNYSEWDRMAIQLLYHPDILPGQPRGVALQTADRVLREALAEST